MADNLCLTSPYLFRSFALEEKTVAGHDANSCVSIHSRPVRRLTPRPTDRGRADRPSLTGGVSEKDFIGSAVLSTSLFPLKGEVSNHKGIFDEEAENRERLAGVFQRIHRRHTARKVHDRTPYTACRKCGAMAWEQAYDDWYCFRCGNRGYWHGAGAEREFVQGGAHGA